MCTNSKGMGIEWMLIFLNDECVCFSWKDGNTGCSKKYLGRDGLKFGSQEGVKILD